MTLHHDLHAAGYFFNPRIQYKDDVHNDGEVMRGTINVITRIARSMNERLDAVAEVERYKMKVGIYGGYDMTYAAQRLSPAGRPFEEVVPEIDVDELLNEEHPLHAWVETRAEGELADFHPEDRLVQACEGDVLLEEHVPERAERPELRRSSTVHDTSISSSQPELRRSTSQLEPKRKKDKGKKKAKPNKERRTEEPRRKSQEAEEDSPEAETHIGQLFSEAPPLPSHLARLYEAEKLHYERRKKKSTKEKEKIVGSDDSTQSPDDDDGAAAGIGATGGYGLGGIMSGYEDYSQPPQQQQGSQGEAQQQHGGYEGQQRQAGHDWGYGASYPPFFSPPKLPYSDISSSSGPSYLGNIQTTGYGSFFPPGHSGESSSQQATTPRGIQRGFQDIANSLFGFGYTQYGGHEYVPPIQSHEVEDEGSEMSN
ncbi:hypothetical protein Taro_025479 [Colocasia esculenta]|uniref:Uncharacterized protein n=1 Tax=Colocasia esculenta TaxID=4460 RepID=A0A843VKN1_COLES|nr:hypothetical protein [Colocasia esculenta]